MADNNDDVEELHPSQVIGAYSQPLLAGRRVAVLGDSTTGLPEMVAKASGRRVHAYDPNRERVATALAGSRGRRAPRVTHALLDESLDSRDGVFDAVVIADLSELSDVEAPLRLAQNLLSPRGLLLLASPNPDWASAGGPKPRAAIGYYDLYDLLSEIFDHVRMLGQAPFLGYTVAEFAAEGEPGVTIDSSLTDRAEEPAYYVAIASNRAIDLDPYTLIQVPAEAGRSWLWPDTGSVAPQVDTEEVAQAQRQLAALEGELDALRGRQRDTERLARERRQAATTLSARVAELEAALQEKTRQLETDDKHRSSLTAMSTRVAELEAALQEKTRQLETDDKRRGSLREELARKLRATEEQRARDLERFEQERLAADEAHQVDLDMMLERIAELEGDEEPDGAVDEPAATTETDETVSPGVVRAYEFQLSELKKALGETRGERDDLRAEVARLVALEAELATARQEHGRAVAETDPQIVDHSDEEVSRRHAAEIDDLEGHLKERGALVARLQAELKESERIGRELLRELEVARSGLAAGQPTAPPEMEPAPVAAAPQTVAGSAGTPPAGQLEALAQKCCRYEADAQAARWTIAALEAKLADRPEPSAVDEQLAEALRNAQQELAELRRRLPGNSDD